MLEKELEARLVHGVKALGGRAYKFVSPGNVGVPDRIVVLPEGRIIFVELKADFGRVSAVQQKQIQDLRRVGCRVEVVRGLQGVERFLQECRTARGVEAG